MRKNQIEQIAIDDSELFEFTERATAEDRTRGIEEKPDEINFRQIAKEWKTKKGKISLNKQAIEIEARLEGDRLALALLSPVPNVPISVQQNEIYVGNLRIAIMLRK
jgi:hypothetical protein